MMYHKSKIEQEVDEIRLAIYERTKDMTRDELNAYYRKSGEAAALKYGFKIYANAEEAERAHAAAAQ